MPLQNERKALESISTLAHGMESAANKQISAEETSAALNPIIGQALVFALLAIAEAIYESNDSDVIAKAIAGSGSGSPRWHGHRRHRLQQGHRKLKRWHRGDCPEIWGYGCACGGIDPPSEGRDRT